MFGKWRKLACVCLAGVACINTIQFESCSWDILNLCSTTYLIQNISVKRSKENSEIWVVKGKIETSH